MIRLDAGWWDGVKSEIVEVVRPGEGRCLVLTPAFSGEDWSGLDEVVAHWNGQGWVADTKRSAKSAVARAYGLLHEAGLVTYTGLRSSDDRPVWEPVR